MVRHFPVLILHVYVTNAGITTYSDTNRPSSSISGHITEDL